MPPPAPVFSADHPFAIFLLSNNYGEFNEQGTEAVTKIAADLCIVQLVDFIADRPFFSFIVHANANALFGIVFHG
ncbi:hypothetical protein niasHT_019051 [Heterodera trifolii]|uniref:Uncharacterized protein n=1 Tax=Heterodera trifolii TaxID=157864 RepID=A0ABD2LAV9_9BILA